MSDQATGLKLLTRKVLLIFVFRFAYSSNTAMPLKQPSLECPKATGVTKFGWILHTESKMCFRSFEAEDRGRKDWNSHREQCQAIGPGYDLASPDSQSQWDFIAKNIVQKLYQTGVAYLGFRTCPADAPLVGGSDKWIRDNFCYSNGSTRLMVTDAWHEGEPKGGWNGPEMCAFSCDECGGSWFALECGVRLGGRICAGPALNFLSPIINALNQDSATLLQKALNVSVLQPKIGPVSDDVAELYMEIIKNSTQVSGRIINDEIYLIDILKPIRQVFIDAVNEFLKYDNDVFLEALLIHPLLGLKPGTLDSNETEYILQNVRNKYEQTKPCPLQIADLQKAAWDAWIPLLMGTFTNGTDTEKRTRAETWFKDLQIEAFKKAVADGNKPEIWAMLSNKGLVDARIDVRQDSVVYSNSDSDLYDKELVNGLIKAIGTSGPQVTLANAAIFVKGHIVKNLRKTLNAGDKNSTMSILQTPALGLGCLREEHATFLYEGLQTTMDYLKANGDNLTLAVFEPRIKILLRELPVQLTSKDTHNVDRNKLSKEHEQTLERDTRELKEADGNTTMEPIAVRREQPTSTEIVSFPTGLKEANVNTTMEPSLNKSDLQKDRPEEEVPFPTGLVFVVIGVIAAALLTSFGAAQYTKQFLDNGSVGEDEEVGEEVAEMKVTGKGRSTRGVRNVKFDGVLSPLEEGEEEVDMASLFDDGESSAGLQGQTSPGSDSTTPRLETPRPSDRDLNQPRESSFFRDVTGHIFSISED